MNIVKMRNNKLLMDSVVRYEYVEFFMYVLVRIIIDRMFLMILNVYIVILYIFIK